MYLGVFLCSVTKFKLETMRKKHLCGHPAKYSPLSRLLKKLAAPYSYPFINRIHMLMCLLLNSTFLINYVQFIFEAKFHLLQFILPVNLA